jgi:hypothetical protein
MVATFLSTLPMGHEIRSTSSAAALKKRLADSGQIKGQYGRASVPDLKEMAAALVWLADVNTDINTQSLTALHASQRATLCRMFAVPLGSNVPTTVNMLMQALGQVAERQDEDQPQPPPAGSFLALIQDSLKDDYGEVAATTMDECRAILRGSPFDPAATGSAMPELAQARELCAMLRWCYAFLHAIPDFGRVSLDLSREIARCVGVLAVPANARNGAALARIDKWRRELAPMIVDVSMDDKDKSADGGVAKSLRDWSLDSPEPPAAKYMAGGSSPAWWIHRLGFVPDEYSGVQYPAEHNILAPDGIGRSSTPGSSAWDAMRGSGATRLEVVAQKYGGDHVAELSQYLAQMSSLYVDAIQLISSEERTQLIASRKAEDGRNRMAAPSLASWPWLQDLNTDLAKSANTFDWGRMLSVALRVDNDRFHGVVDGLSRGSRQTARQELVERFRVASAEANLSAILLAVDEVQALAQREMETAYAQAYVMLGRFPKCPMVVEVAAGRERQRSRLEAFMTSISKTVKLGAARKMESERPQYMAGAYIRFFEGFNSAPAASEQVDKQYMSAGSGFSAAAAPQGATGVGRGAGSGAGGAGFSSPGAGAGGRGGAGQAGGALAGASGLGRGAPTGQGKKQVSFQTGTQRQQQQQQQQNSGASGCRLGVHIPCSKAIVGPEIGIEGPGRTFKCWTCDAVGQHYKGECPVAWGKLGKTLPGFDKDGDKLTRAWNDDVPKRKTYDKWVKFLKDADNYPAGEAVPANVRDAPDMAQFEDRAANARP